MEPIQNPDGTWFFPVDPPKKKRPAKSEACPTFTTKPKLQKIERGLDTIGKCAECKREIKNIYWTDHGPLGMNCFLTAIGLPRHSEASKKLPPLPADQLESMALYITPTILVAGKPIPI